ncbi:MAG: putative toxin-antitoxin system toxin component, PIN family, partial [Candidatus Altiarchaeota archaeon]
DTNVIVSGLFFSGNERRLLKKALEGKIHLILPQDVIEETESIIRRKFGETHDLPQAMFVFNLLKEKAEIVPRKNYKGQINKAKSMISDPKDAPILAFLLHSKPDIFVTGDQDFKNIKLKTKTKIQSASILVKEF